MSVSSTVDFRECDICFTRLEHPEDRYPLDCCQHNCLCRHCFEKLLSCQCPFCRSPLLSMPLACQSSRTLSSSSPSFQEIPSWWTQMDAEEGDITRSRRRQWRRLQKLEQRRRDQVYNQELRFALRRSMSSYHMDVRRYHLQTIFEEQQDDETMEGILMSRSI